jgi:NAD+ dependent glucose-6-phosphate dehydrogenase
MRVLITGAAGQIGREIVDELSRDHDLCLIDRLPIKGRPSLVADLSRQPPGSRIGRLFSSKSRRWSDVFVGAQVVIHLAAERRPTAPWEKVLADNIRGTWNVIEAAARSGVPRVIFASSNWAVRALERKMAPDCYRVSGPKIGSDTSPAPLGAYGLSKATGELVGRMFVDNAQLRSFVAVRIGNYSPEPSEDPEAPIRRIGTHDLRSLFRRCVEAEFEGFHVVYGVSAQTIAPYDLSHTRRLLCWEPQEYLMNFETVDYPPCLLPSSVSS